MLFLANLGGTFTCVLLGGVFFSLLGLRPFVIEKKTALVEYPNHMNFANIVSWIGFDKFLALTANLMPRIIFQQKWGEWNNRSINYAHKYKQIVSFSERYKVKIKKKALYNYLILSTHVECIYFHISKPRREDRKNYIEANRLQYVSLQLTAAASTCSRRAIPTSRWSRNSTISYFYSIRLQA